MDEPLSSLDFDLALRLRREILQLHEKLRYTLLYVTHNRAGSRRDRRARSG
jgi:ABC-type sugar transport system ATPase subunit